MTFTLPLTYEAKLGQPCVLDGDFIEDEQMNVMTLKLFEKTFMLDTLEQNEACVTITMPTKKAHAY